MSGRKRGYLEVVVELDATELASARFGLFLADVFLDVGFFPGGVLQTAFLAGLSVCAEVEELATELFVESTVEKGEKGDCFQSSCGMKGEIPAGHSRLKRGGEYWEGS